MSRPVEMEPDREVLRNLVEAMLEMEGVRVPANDESLNELMRLLLHEQPRNHRPTPPLHRRDIQRRESCCRRVYQIICGIFK